jgi:hypothetical protein
MEQDLLDRFDAGVELKALLGRRLQEGTARGLLGMLTTQGVQQDWSVNEGPS